MVGDSVLSLCCAARLLQPHSAPVAAAAFRVPHRRRRRSSARAALIRSRNRQPQHHHSMWIGRGLSLQEVREKKIERDYRYAFLLLPAAAALAHDGGRRVTVVIGKERRDDDWGQQTARCRWTAMSGGTCSAAAVGGRIGRRADGSRAAQSGRPMTTNPTGLLNSTCVSTSRVRV